MENRLYCNVKIYIPLFIRFPNSWRELHVLSLITGIHEVIVGPPQNKMHDMRVGESYKQMQWCYRSYWHRTTAVPDGDRETRSGSPPSAIQTLNKSALVAHPRCISVLTAAQKNLCCYCRQQVACLSDACLETCL